MPRIPDIQIRVIPALRLRGSRKAGIPFEIASTPVSAAVPLLKAWSSRNRPMARVGSMSSGGGSETAPSAPDASRTKATPTVRNIIARKK